MRQFADQLDVTYININSNVVVALNSRVEVTAVSVPFNLNIQPIRYVTESQPGTKPKGKSADSRMRTVAHRLYCHL